MLDGASELLEGLVELVGSLLDVRASNARDISAMRSISSHESLMKNPRPAYIRTPYTAPDPDAWRKLPFLTHIDDLAPAAWLRESMTTFGIGVKSFLPGHFEAYARLFHPLVPPHKRTDPPLTWRAAAAAANYDLTGPHPFEAFSPFYPDARALHGSMTAELIQPLLESLKHGTTTPDTCFFAIWEGYGASLVPPDLEPRLDLPHRRYHVFKGPIEAAHTTFGELRQSANLWWPSDQAWCVASEIDLMWTYIGGSRQCIDAVLKDTRLETIETTAMSRS